MKSKKILATLLAASIMASAGLVGCGKKGAGADKAAGADGMDKEQYLNVVLLAEPKSLDQSKSSDLYSSQVISEVLEGLTRIEQDKDGKDVVKAAGAESWKTSDDGITWTFKLRDYEWSDGKKVTAKDFEYGIKRTLDPKTASNYAFLLSPIKGADAFNGKKADASAVGVKAIDDKTLEIKLEKPCAYFLDLTYFKVMLPQRQDIVEKAGDKYGTEANTMVFCGPFTIKEWVHQNKVELEKNAKYWDAKSVKLNKVTMKIIKDESARMNELLNGSLDAAAVTKPEWIKKFDEAGKFNVMKGFDPSTSYHYFNQKDKLFSNAKVRKAFSLAITREDVVKVLYKGLAAPAYGFCPPSLQIGGKDFRELAAVEPIKKLVEENKDPKALLIEGLKELGMDPDPSKVVVTYLESGTAALNREFAEYSQQMYLKALGVQMKVEYMEWPVFQKRTESMDYQMAGMAWAGDYNDPMTEFDMWVTDTGMVPTGWSNKKYDDLIKQSQNTTDQKARLEIFKQAEKILLYDDCVIAPTVYRMRNTYREKYVKNVMSPLFGSGSELKYAYTSGRGK